MIYHLATFFNFLTFINVFSILQPVSAIACGKPMSWNGGQGTYDEEQVTDQLTLYNNVWGADSTAAGSSQTVQCLSNKGSSVSWTTSFDFISKDSSLDYQVKSYSNLGWAGKPIQISTLQSFHIDWNWSMSEESSDLTTNVSLDIFTSTDGACSGQSGQCATHEIMVWLVAKGGARPAGSSTQKTVSVANYAFEIFKGSVGGIPVISLFPEGGKSYTSFSADLIHLLQIELCQFGVSPDEYIVTVGSGCEPYKGVGTLHSTYSLSIA
ncbi:endoglucanase [Melampsora larici-populina 98AG31]|uniref:Endoglucanase n=1 Tax=Melampsora larici-populina (strain 98AG31 / pathotype 3-4-7) TaxID=747676 RepID=F4SA13_MELLP|nr:endoglucanase [Melampsora larici-populina 98AG31]EGF98517.1 endoglucanase [Melampsora larici-populina 98AG31]